MKYLACFLIPLATFCLGVYLTDSTFSKQHGRYLNWQYEYVADTDSFERCLYLWKRESERSARGKKLLCLPKQYPL